MRSTSTGLPPFLAPAARALGAALARLPGRWRLLAPILVVVSLLAASCRLGARRGSAGDSRRGPAAGALELAMQESAGLERKLEPVRAGLPFPPAALGAPGNLRVVGSDGREMPSQRRVLASWPDGSVRWLELIFEPSVAAGAVGRYRVEFGPRVRAGKVQAPLLAEVQKGLVRVDTGRLCLELPAAAAASEGPPRNPAAAGASVWLDADGDGKYSAEERVLAGPGLELFAELEALKPGAPSGRFAAAAASGAFELEESGPLRACLAWRGWHSDGAGRKACPFVLRVYAYRGKSFLRVTHTLTLSEDPAAARVTEAGLALALRSRAAPAGRALRQTVAAPKRYPDLAGFEVRAVLAEGDKVLADGAAQLCLAATCGRCELVAAPARPVEDAPWELRIEPDGSRLVAALWPRWGAEFTDARAPEERAAPGFAEFTSTESYDRFWPRARPASALGAARTHELWLDFAPAGGGSGARGSDFAAQVGAPLVAWPGAEWFSYSDAFGPFAPRERAGEGDPSAALELGGARLADWLRGHQRERFGWLGLWDYGDYQTIYRERAGLNIGARWWNWSGPWGWLQGREGFPTAFLTAWLRAGREADWESFRAAAEHNLEVDTVHAVGREAGLVGATHGPGASHWSAPASLAATCPAVWLDYYYLSGERRGLEAVADLAGSLGGRSIGDFAEKGRPYGAEQAGCLRARLAAHEALGAQGAAAARAALDFFDALPGRELGSELWARELAPALIRYHRLTGSEVAARLLERGTRAYLASRGPAARGSEIERNCYDACAYAWRLTGDGYFLERGRGLVERSGSERAGSLRLEPGAKLPADLATDAREVLELATIPYLLAAEQEAGAGGPAPAAAAPVTRARP